MDNILENTDELVANYAEMIVNSKIGDIQDLTPDEFWHKWLLSGHTEIPKQYQNDEVFEAASYWQLVKMEESFDSKDTINSALKSINETTEIINTMKESAASDKAKKLGLVHLGFGMYGKKKDGAPKYKTVDGKLVKSTKKVSASKKDTVKDDAKKKKGLEIADIKSVQRVKGQKFSYSYTIVGHKPQVISLNKKEIEKVDDKHESVKDIIFDRLKASEKKRKLKAGIK